MKTIIVELDGKTIQKLSLPETFKGNFQDIADDLKLSHYKNYDPREIKTDSFGLSSFKEKAKYRFLK